MLTYELWTWCPYLGHTTLHNFVFQVFSGSDSSEPDRSKDDFSWVNGAIDTKPSDVEIETLNDENTFKVMIVFVKIAAVYVGLSLRQFVRVFSFS